MSGRREVNENEERFARKGEEESVDEGAGEL